MLNCPECSTPMTTLGKVDGLPAIACSKCHAVYALVRCIQKQSKENDHEHAS